MKKYRMRERMHEELVPDLLHARGIVEPDEVERFLAPDFERDTHDPFLLPDMGQAVERILAAAQTGEKVAVWSDYDCDGIPGGVMLAQFLRELGLPVRHYIPHRHGEGYGLNTDGIEELAKEGVTLIVTVDLGTTDHGPVAFACSRGIDVIIADHHLPTAKSVDSGYGDLPPGKSPEAASSPLGKPPPSAILPPALAVINPKRSDSLYPFADLCGSGVAWKLVQAVLRKIPEIRRSFDYARGREKWLLDLVGLGTLTDMVPLRGENRMLAHYGLLVMRKARRPGLAALFSLLRIRPASLTEDDIGFMVAPRINAASRMDSPEIAAELLATRDGEEAVRLARILQKLNDERKGVVAATVKEIKRRIGESQALAQGIIVMGNPNWRPGILGLVANSIAESTGTPVCLWGREGSETIRGSFRSDGSCNVVGLMQGIADLFDDYGGHAFSGGFSLKEERVHELAPRLAKAYEALSARVRSEPEVVLDRELPLEEVAPAARSIAALAPFGESNPKPLFLFSGVSIASIRSFGRTQDHLEVALVRGTAAAMGISFFSTPESFSKKIFPGARVDVVGHIECDWRGAPRIRVVDIL